MVVDEFHMEYGAVVLTHGDVSVRLDRSADPSPCDRALSRIDLAGGSGPIVVRCFQSQTRCGSEATKLQLGHIEYFAVHDYLVESADPLVVALR